MQYDEMEHLRANHPAWVLLRADNAVLVLTFLGRVFVDANASALPASELASELDDELYALNERLGEVRFPRPAAAYLDDWASPERGWLRKFYIAGSDEARYDLAPAVEKALLWVRDLRSRDFIGTESRLNTIFELLRQMVFGAATDPDQRLAELRRQRAEIDEAIARTERGDIEILGAAAQRDRYQQFARMARELLSDFREVEENFRRLDREMREQIAGWKGAKGELLDQILSDRSSIAESDQGRSFHAFYDLLLSSQRQEELTRLLQALPQLDPALDHDPHLARIHFDWIAASERTQATVRMLSEQLRRFLDDQVWLENRRVFDLLQGIEAKALKLRDAAPTDDVMELDDNRVTFLLPMERPLYRRSRKVPLDTGAIEPGEDDFDSSALLDQIYVDREELTQRVLASLAHQEQVGIDEIVARQPLRQGLAELIGYLSLHEPGVDVVFDDEQRIQVSWTAKQAPGSRSSADGKSGSNGVGEADLEVERVADLPRVTFTRNDPETS